MRALVCFSMAALLVACSTGSGVVHQPKGRPAATPTLTADIPAAATPTGGCGESPVYRGPIPTWLEVADGENTPSGLPWVVATPPIAAGFIFTDPLRAGHPENPYNKVLWVVRTPRAGSDLEMTARPLGASSPALSSRSPDNSGPGEIYPDILDVPSAGCWRFDLRWANGRATVDLEYA
jgi:hypothetical protein